MIAFLMLTSILIFIAFIFKTVIDNKKRKGE